MTKFLSALLLCFYASGMLCLPMGDFSYMRIIPDMYNHCKLTEDKDMNTLDFITDHLINIDSLFDQHAGGDEQKPHQPLQNQHRILLSNYFQPKAELSIEPISFSKKRYNFNLDDTLPLDYTSDIFRPPIFA